MRANKIHSAKRGLGKSPNPLLPSADSLAISVRRASFLLARRYTLPGFDEFAAFD